MFLCKQTVLLGELARQDGKPSSTSRARPCPAVEGTGAAGMGVQQAPRVLDDRRQHTCIEDNLQGLTHVVRLAGKHLYPRSHLLTPFYSMTARGLCRRRGWFQGSPPSLLFLMSKAVSLPEPRACSFGQISWTVRPGKCLSLTPTAGSQARTIASALCVGLGAVSTLPTEPPPSYTAFVLFTHMRMHIQNPRHTQHVHGSQRTTCGTQFSSPRVGSGD